MPPENTERLQKILAHAGVASRRRSEKLIEQGRVSVNSQTVTTLGAKADPARDDIRVDGRRIQAKVDHLYVMVNKPRGVLSTMEDARGRKSLSDVVEVATRVYPVGRLDAASEGLILLTDDGELANLLTHPRYQHEKDYRVLVNGRPSQKTLEAWRRGVMWDGKLTAPAQVEVIRYEKNGTLLRVVLREGRKRQIREVASLLGHPAQGLLRVRLGPLKLGGLETGQWRYLTAQEVRELKGLKQFQRRRSRKSRRRK